jgi:FixJ family two-component response regulator
MRFCLPAICPLVVRRRADLSNAVMISIVDDNESVREATKTLIRSLGYATSTFASAEEYLQSGSVRVELQNRLMTDGYRTPMIFVTAFPKEKWRTRALEAGAFGFLSKPFDAEQLIECLDRVLQKKGPGSAQQHALV